MTRTLPDWLAYIERQHPKSIDMGLERVREVAQRMGLARPARQVITVGGTNGKGSTVAFIEAIARAAGMMVGAYTSPHLLAYNERVRIGGVDAGDAELIEAFEAVDAAACGDAISPSTAGKVVGERVRCERDDDDVPTRHTPGVLPAGRPPSGPLLPAGEGKYLRPVSSRLLSQGEETSIPLTYFEYSTLAALWLFERAGLDLAILEVGLGGRLDATNLFDSDVAVITTVDLDHQDYLGNDRESIGFEKAGIARSWKPLVLGDDDPPSSVLRHAYVIGASALRAGCDFFFEPVDAGRWRWREVGYELLLPMPRLVAPAQLRNAAVAIAALRALTLEIPDEAIAAGIAAADIPARLQRFERDGVDVVVDVGHNPQAARELAAWLASSPARGRTLAVFAALADKDAAGLVAVLAPVIDAWHLAGLAEHGPRGADVATFAQRLARTEARDGGQYADVAGALAAARVAARPGDRIVVFGSFHTAAAALAQLGGG